ncbi:hypothetical protein OROGR_014100 [Orobanche gracilis]
MVGLLGLGRSLQKEVNRIAEIADTSTSEGLHYVLTGSKILAKYRHFAHVYNGREKLGTVAEGLEMNLDRTALSDQAGDDRAGSQVDRAGPGGGGDVAGDGRADQSSAEDRAEHRRCIRDIPE